MIRAFVFASVFFVGCSNASRANGSACDPALLDSASLESVRDACTHVIETVSDSLSRFQALKTRGRAARSLKDYDAAIGDFEQAIKIKPNDPHVHERLGWAAYGKGDYERAIREVGIAIEIDSRFAAAYDLLGVIATTTPYGGFGLARKALDEAVRLQPGQLSFRMNQFILFDIIGRSDDGLKVLNAVEQDFPAAVLDAPKSDSFDNVMVSVRTTVRLGRGMMLVRLGRYNDARTQYDLAVENESGALTYARRADFGLQHGGSDKDVSQDLEKSLAYDPDFWLARFVSGRVKFYAKEYERALQDFDVALSGAVKNGGLHWWKARTLRALGRPEEAAQSAVIAVTVDGKERDQKLAMLRQRGYLGEIAGMGISSPAIRDAMTACMLDKDCG